MEALLTAKGIHDNLAIYGGIAASLTALFIFRKTALEFLALVWRVIIFPLQLAGKLDDLSDMVADVQHQVKTNNGSSLKDAVVRVETQLRNVVDSFSVLEQYRQNAFWREPRPCLELDRNGQVILISEAACRLFAIVHPESALRQSWLQFLDGHHVEELKRSYRETAATGSLFRFVIRVYDENRNDRGEWELKATPIGPELYSGFFTPIDTVAKEIAGRNNWLR